MENQAINAWDTADANAIAGAEEVQVVTRRPDGTLRRPITIWIGVDAARVFIWSTNGRTADWFRGATATGEIIAAGRTHEICFNETDPADPAAVDAAHRVEYGRYRSIVDHLVEPGRRAATLKLTPTTRAIAGPARLVA